MSSLRYYLALALVVSFPPAVLFWLVVHPLVHFWRRLGPAWTYLIVGTPMLLAMLGMFLARATLLATEFGTRYALAALGVLCLVGAGRLRLLIRERASTWLISGLPELAPDRQASGLLTEGVYARIRHPRYVQIALALLGWTLVANYLATYVVLAVWLAAIYPIVALEERAARALRRGVRVVRSTRPQVRTELRPRALSSRPAAPAVRLAG
jgi:protein-S-isoprenylcysteine O-methyltransferase Ste14